MIPHVGQNPLEPAREGNYILFGPNTTNFKEVYQMLEKLKIASKIKSISNMKNVFLKKINYSRNSRVSKKLNSLGNKIINKNMLEIKKLI